MQAKMPGGAIEADGTGHQTHGWFLRIHYTRRKGAGRQKKKLLSHKDTGRKNETDRQTDVKGGKNIGLRCSMI